MSQKPPSSSCHWYLISCVPRLTRRWRQTIARRAFPDDPVFGPWHDLLKDPVPRPDLWMARGVDSRIISDTRRGRSQNACRNRHGLRRSFENHVEAGAAADDPLAALLIGRDGPVWFPQEDTTFYLDRTPGDKFRGLTAELDAIAVRHPHAAACAMIVADNSVLSEPVIFQRGSGAARQPGTTTVPRRTQPRTTAIRRWCRSPGPRQRHRR
ncbi:MAG UNVERIFIED_CONTAM: hypothetical protein LVR18_25125 [Planctomycetaceae bacterium]